MSSQESNGDTLELATPLGDEEGVLVRPGDCLSSIADARGFFWETLWEHPRNAALKKARTDPNVLLPGDRVFVPELVPKFVACAVDATHRFRRRGVPEILRLQFDDEEGHPRADAPYRLTVGSLVFEGKTDAGGYLEHWVPPKAKHATLELLHPRDPFLVVSTLELEIGALPPCDTLEGTAARLQALGLYAPARDDDRDGLAQALYRFQQSKGLPPSGRLDAPTRDALVEEYGS